MKLGLRFVLIFSIFVTLGNVQIVLSSESSLKPILVPQMEINQFILTNQEINLTWYIIDDNPSSYKLFINNSIFKFGKTTTNIINIPYSNIAGYYIITLEITDYSNNIVNNSIYLTISVGTFTAPASSSTDSSSEGINTGAGTSGLELNLIFLIGLGILVRLKRKSKKE